MRGQTLPCMEGVTGLSRRIFPKGKRPSGALWGIPLQQHIQSPLHPTTRQGTVRTSSWRELRLQAPTRRVCQETRDCSQRPGSVCTHQTLYAPTRECLHLISEGTENTGTRDTANKGSSACTPIARRRPTIKKEWVEAGTPGFLLKEETHQQKKHQQIRREEGEGGRGSNTKSTQNLSEKTNK